MVAGMMFKKEHSAFNSGWGEIDTGRGGGWVLKVRWGVQGKTWSRN